MTTCTHENIDWDLPNTEMEAGDTFSVPIKCTDCGHEGWGYLTFWEIEWK